MPIIRKYYLCLWVFAVVLTFGLESVSCSNVTTLSSDWSPARATWYGSSTGDGSEGGACGYEVAVGQPPFSSMVSAGGPSLFDSGVGCGACYQVQCSSNAACSGEPVTVVITDSCPGCTDASVHFDLSGTAFGAMAILDQADQLRNAGILQIQYRRAECQFPGTKICFHVDSGSNPYYFATVVEFSDGDGELGSVELQQDSTSANQDWLPMQRSWGVDFMLNNGAALSAPFSLKLTAKDSGQTVVAENVIPSGWEPGKSYCSQVNFS